MHVLGNQDGLRYSIVQRPIYCMSILEYLHVQPDFWASEFVPSSEFVPFTSLSLYCHRHRGKLETCFHRKPPDLSPRLPAPSAVALQDAPFNLRYVGGDLRGSLFASSSQYCLFGCHPIYLFLRGRCRQSMQHLKARGAHAERSRGAHTERSPLRHSLLGDTIHEDHVPASPGMTHGDTWRNDPAIFERAAPQSPAATRDTMEELEGHGASSGKFKHQTSPQYSTRHVPFESYTTRFSCLVPACWIYASDVSSASQVRCFGSKAS